MKQILEQARAALDGVMTEYQRHVITTLGDTMFYECDPAVIRAGTALEAIEAALAETSEERVERVARAICKATYYDVEPDMYESEEAFFTKDGPDAWKHFGDSDFMHQARAAIAAMGE
jgi:hypothetical protein